jgi:hypothetical protein
MNVNTEKINKVVYWSPINQLTIALYILPMSSSFNIFIIFDSHEHGLSELPHTCLKFS